MFRLLGLDQNDSYRILYHEIRKTEPQYQLLKARVEDGRRQQTEFQIAANQCKNCLELIEQWIRIKDQLVKLDKAGDVFRNQEPNEEVRMLRIHEVEVAEALKAHFYGEQIDDTTWIKKDRESLLHLQMSVIGRRSQVVAAYEACEKRCREEELLLKQIQGQRNERDMGLVKMVDEAFNLIAQKANPDRIPNATEHHIRMWNEVQKGYQILRNTELHRKCICSENQEEFFEQLSKLQLRGPTSEQVSAVSKPARKSQGALACRMPLVVEEASDSASRLTTVTMQWWCSNSENGVTEYQLQMKGSQQNFEVVYEGKDTMCVLDLLPDEYQFRVRARNGNTTGGFSSNLVYVAHDSSEKKKSMTMQDEYRAQLMANPACRAAEQTLVKAVEDMQQRFDGSKTENFAVVLNEARKYKLDLVEQELCQRATAILKKCWQVPDEKVQRSHWGLKFLVLVKETLTQKSADAFQKLIRSEAWASFDGKTLNLAFNFLVILAQRSLRLNYPIVVVDGSLRILNAVLQAKKSPPNPFWVRRIKTLFELLKRKRNQQWNQAKSKNAKAAVRPSAKSEQKKETEKKREQRESERQAARLREQKRKALHEKLFRQQLAQGKVPPKSAKTSQAKPAPKVQTKPASKFRPYPKHHQQGKFQICKFWVNGQNCRKQPCWFAHGNEELQDWYRQREEEQQRKKQHKKGTGTEQPSGSATPESFSKPKATKSSPESSSPGKTKEAVKPRLAKPTPAPVVKSVWQKPSAKRQADGPGAFAELESMEKKLSGMWQGKSTDANQNAMIWQSCDLKFNLDGQQGSIVGTCICVLNRETVSFKVEGQLRYPEVTLIRNASKSISSREVYQLKIESLGGQLKMQGRSHQSWIQLVRAPAKDSLAGKASMVAPKAVITPMLPPSAGSTPLLTQRSSSVETYGIKNPIADGFAAPRVPSLLEKGSKSSPGLFNFGMLGNERNSRNSSPATIGPIIGHSPASEPVPDRKIESTSQRPIRIGGNMFSSFGTVWGSLNATEGVPKTELKSNVGSSPVENSAIGYAVSRNGFPPFALPRSSKPAVNSPQSKFGFPTGGLSNGTNGRLTNGVASTGIAPAFGGGGGSLFSSMRQSLDTWSTGSSALRTTKSSEGNGDVAQNGNGHLSENQTSALLGPSLNLWGQ